ncbi:transposase [Novosphingobium sp. Rr 2-17]|nr:transposase [Novosphingobium sp. Rr 2-17]
MKVLAHIREQYRLSLGSYGRPRMTMELKEVGSMWASAGWGD